jgi:hypothetical protein
MYVRFYAHLHHRLHDERNKNCLDQKLQTGPQQTLCVPLYVFRIRYSIKPINVEKENQNYCVMHKYPISLCVYSITLSLTFMCGVYCSPAQTFEKKRKNEFKVDGRCRNGLEKYWCKKLENKKFGQIRMGISCEES